MPARPKKPISPAVIIAASEQEIIDFLNDCPLKNGTRDISSITDIDTISSHERDALSDKLNNALRKMNPLDTDRLHQLLGALDSSSVRARPPFDHTDTDTDSDRTLTPPPTLDPIVAQDRDRAKLVQAGGRPIMPMEQLDTLSLMTEKDIARAALWLDLPEKTHVAYNEVLPLFSKQLEHWRMFQQYWQWGNRGAAGRDKGSAAFFASHRERYLEEGEIKAVTHSDFEGMTQRIWRDEVLNHMVSLIETDGFASYVGMMKKHLESRSFTRPFTLTENPSDQDEWTTWVEYLYYNYWQIEKDKARMKQSEPRYRRAMRELLLPEDERCSLETNQKMPLQHQLKEASDSLRKWCAKFRRIRSNIKDYLTYEALVRRGELRAEWVLKELTLIENNSVKKERRKEEENPFGADPEVERKAVDVRASGTITTGDSIDVRIQNGRQLRKRKRDDERLEQHLDTGVSAQGEEAGLPAPSKRSRTRDGRSFASPMTTTTNTTSVAGLPLKRKLCRSQRSQDAGGGAAMRVVQPDFTNNAVIDKRLRPTRRKKRLKKHQ